ncbi:glutathione S-transferase [Colwellia sp. KU-HH00111]|uniref:glutathione S-transferase family protein n=1 Tax=Colwellia sp. KU-HH00111 TaxID=3127652 RepID=UPI0031086343
MITVHHLNKSRSKRVIWLLEELSMAYTLVTHQRDPITNLAPESLRLIHPLAKAPIIVDGETTLCESGAILEYILNKAPSNQLKPAPNTTQYVQYLEWLHFAEGSLALPVISTLLMSMETRSGDKPLDGYIAKEIALDFSYIDQTLAKQPYFAGDEFSAADIMMTITLEIANNLKLIEACSNIQRYLEKVQQRPAYQVANSHG